MKKNSISVLKWSFYFESAARLERKSFFACTKVLFKLKWSCKKDWERKAEIAAKT